MLDSQIYRAGNLVFARVQTQIDQLFSFIFFGEGAAYLLWRFSIMRYVCVCDCVCWWSDFGSSHKKSREYQRQIHPFHAWKMKVSNEKEFAEPTTRMRVKSALVHTPSLMKLFKQKHKEKKRRGTVSEPVKEQKEGVKRLFQAMSIHTRFGSRKASLKGASTVWWGQRAGFECNVPKPSKGRGAGS